MAASAGVPEARPGDHDLQGPEYSAAGSRKEGSRPRSPPARPIAGQPAKPDARQWRRLRWRAMRKATLWAALVVYAVYFLLSWNQPLNIPGLAGHDPLVALLGRLLMPPWLFLCGLAFVRSEERRVGKEWTSR